MEIGYRLPTEEDWIAVQGGKPSVANQGRLTVICHDYPDGEGQVVKSFHSVEDMGTVLLQVEEDFVLFPVALLVMFHGNPCERQSARGAGGQYERRK